MLYLHLSVCHIVSGRARMWLHSVIRSVLAMGRKQREKPGTRVGIKVRVTFLLKEVHDLIASTTTFTTRPNGPVLHSG